MSSINPDNDASLAEFTAGWNRRLRDNQQLPVHVAVLVLTSFGERPVASLRLAEVLARPVSEVETRALGHCTTAAPVEDPLVRVEDGLITWLNPDRAKSAPRRWLQIGDRRFGMTGCAPDVFLYAPLIRPSLQVEETCPATGTPIRLVFTASRVESVDPAGVVVPILPPQEFDRLAGMTIGEADATMCAQCPFYSSAESVQGWLAAHPGGRVFPVREAWDLSFHRIWRDRMSALLNRG
ncbi:MAG: organomercurial lyase [Streptosporangiaceae bacterium]